MYIPIVKVHLVQGRRSNGRDGTSLGGHVSRSLSNDRNLIVIPSDPSAIGHTGNAVDEALMLPSEA